MRILICAYRDWALSVVRLLIQEKFDDNPVDLYLVKSPEDLTNLVAKHKFDAIILLGWSWKVAEEVVKNNLVVGMHPSALPKYSGGSPIQHQILDGVTNTVATLFRLTEKFDDGDIILTEPISLEGSMNDVLSSIENASYNLIIKFVNQHPNHTFLKQNKEEGFVRKRIKPEDSKLTIEKLSAMTCKQLYDFIRCREAPYPNVYLEDETGRLLFSGVLFEEKKNI